MSQSTDILWGAVLEAVDLDITSQTLTISCRVEDSGETTRHELKITEISELRFFNSIPGPWAYAELTEIHVNITPYGKVQAEIVLWSESAELVAVAGSVELDGTIHSRAHDDLPHFRGSRV